MAESLQQITTLPSLGGCPGVKAPVGAVVALSLVNGVGLGEDFSALYTLSKFFTFCSIEVPPFGLSWKITQHSGMSTHHKPLH